MPVLDLTDWSDNPAVTRMKILALMLYPNHYSMPCGAWYGSPNAHELLADTISDHYGFWDETNDGETIFLPYTNVGQWPYQDRWAIASSLEIGLSNDFEVRCGRETGWMLWAVKRLCDAGSHDDHLNKASYLLKKIWETHNPGETISRETLLDTLQAFQPVAHLWAAYWLSGAHCTDELHWYSRFDLSFLKDDFPAFLARAESFRRFGEQQRILSPEETWAVPRDFPLPNVAIDSPPLTDEENTCLEEYHLLTEDDSVVSVNEAQVVNNDGKNVFRKDGDYWNITYKGQTIHLKHIKGLQHIAYLLKYAGQEVSSTHLSVTFSNSSTNPVGEIYRDMSAEDLDEEHLRVSDLGDAGEVLDDQAKREYQNRLRDLQEDLEEAEENNDLGQIERLRQEMDALETELSRAVGIRGQDRVAASPANRARINVQKQIKAAIEQIDQRHSKLAQHLRRTIKTGHCCSYSPDLNSPPLWTF